MKKNQITIIGGVVLVGIIIGAVAFIFLTRGNDAAEETQQTTKKSSINFVEISPEEIGLELTPIQNNQVIRMEIGNPEGISSIDYELSYDAVENDVEVSRGAVGMIDFEKGDSAITEIDLGTCSSGVCKYDKGVEAVQFVLRVNYTDRDPGIVETDLVFE